MGEMYPPTAADYAWENARAAERNAQSASEKVDKLAALLEAKGVLQPGEWDHFKRLGQWQ